MLLHEMHSFVKHEICLLCDKSVNNFGILLDSHH